jgi:hypothetical protein
VAEAIGAAEAAADEAQQQILALQHEAAGLRATNQTMHQMLDELHTAAAKYQVTEVSAQQRAAACLPASLLLPPTPCSRRPSQPCSLRGSFMCQLHTNYILTTY